MKITKGLSSRFILIAGCICCLGSIAIAQAPSVEQPAGNEQLIQLIETEFKPVVTKDEFESTDAFNKRIRKNVDREFLITIGLEKETVSYRKNKAFSYNADTQTLTVTLVGDSSLEIMKIIDPLSEEAKQIGPGNMLNGRYTKFTLTKTEPKLEREYIGQNAMGASTKISVYGSNT